MIPREIYTNYDSRYNLNQLNELNLSRDFIETIQHQAQSVACLIDARFLRRREGGWQFYDNVPTLAQQQEQLFGEQFGENEAFQNEFTPAFGTAFLVTNQLALTAACCVCHQNSNEIYIRILESTRLVFGFHDVREDISDYFFSDEQVRRVTVVAFQRFRAPGRNTAYSEWTDWALLKLDREVFCNPLSMNLRGKVSNRIELYMLGHPNGLPLKFTHNGEVRGNTEANFFECNLNTFAGNGGSPVFNVFTKQVEGILIEGNRDYEVVSNYRGTDQIRIQVVHITNLMVNQNPIGRRLENCQRTHVLRHLVDRDLLDLRNLEPVQNASTLLVNSLKECYQSRNTIPRLLHSALPIKEIYTELVLLNKNKEDKEKDEPIELHSIFENIEGKSPKRLLILGRAGTGKSTLCHHIAHQWAEGKLWNEKFDALFWIPLRKLQNIHSAETVSSFIFRTCCQEKDQRLYVKDIADYVRQNAERTLFVLDGLDEVSIEDNCLQKKIVDELLKFPYWITTSRPHAAWSIQADSTIENAGFASKTIDHYIQKSFPINAHPLIQKIRQNPIIFDLCHIPIHLELVCSILKKSKEDISFIRSMTGLYEELTLILQKRFLEKIGRPEVWEYTQGDLKHDSQVNQMFNLLESIAWTPQVF
ncbi:MAG: serine protease [Parachlamydiaceae bacterium]|nr:serine protease [Parachlamydiaceae bacterium]